MLSKHYPLTLLVQQGYDLGERMEQTFRHLAAQGFRRRIIIGTDSPTLPLTIIQEAFRQLEDHNLVLGPSHDGGYYLIGLSSEIPPIFNGIPWGTQQVLTQTLQRINESAIPMYLLPFWYDVDTFEDLSFLKEHLSHLSEAGHPIPKRTHFYLNTQLNKEQPHA
jgi:rSAM/selenodomain-associated transferase 1